jgi:exonuclease VII small subunit
MPITAVFTSDFTKFNDGLRNAVAAIKPLEVSAKGVQSQLERMAKSLSGADIIKQANLATAAVKAVGGATTLTATEQKKLNATVTEAIAKYAALGQKAPADMLALAKATKQSESAFSGIASTLGPLKGLIAGAFAVGTVTRLAGDALQFASDLNDLSAKTGISTKALQEFKFAGDQVGVTLDDVSTAVLQMQKHLAGGDKSALDALKKIGVSFTELKGLAPEDQFKRIAEGLSKIEDPALRNKTAFDIMGKAAANVLPLIASDLKKTSDEAARLGIVLDQQTIDQLDNLGDTWAKVKLAGEALIAKALVPLVPAILKILEAIGPLSRDMGKLPTDFKKLEIELLQLAVITRQAAISFLELTKWTQPLNVATGQYEKSVKSIQGEMLGLIEKVGKAQQELRDMEAPQKSVTDGAKKAAAAFGDWGDEVKKTAEKLGQGSEFMREELSKLATALEKVEERSDAAFEALNQADELLSLKQQLDQVANRITKVDEAETEWIEGTSHLLVNKSTVVKQYFDMLVKKQEEAAKAAHLFEDALTKIGEDIPNILAQAFVNHASFEDTVKALGTKIGADLGEAIGGAVGGPIGAAIGEALGSLLGPLLDKLIKTRGEQLQSSVLHDFGVSIGEDLGNAIADSAIKEFKGSFTAAQIGNLDKIISAGGGITLKNLDQLEARLHDVFSLMQTGELTAAQGQDVLNKNFQTFVDFLGGDVDPALKEIIRLNKEFGTQSKAILDYIAKNASLAAGGFNKIAANLLQLTTGFTEGSDDLKMLQDAINGVADSTKKVAKEAPEAHRGIEELKRAASGGAGFSTDFTDVLRKDLERIGPIAQATFGALLDGGKSVTEALAEMAPGLQEIQKILKATGVEATGFLGQILGWQDIVTNNKGVFDALSGTLDLLKGLNNAGALTQDAFTALAGNIDEAFLDLTVSGVSATDAIKLMQPELQEIWELQKDFGFAVDDATQKLLDQGVAAGEVGEKHRSVQEQMLDLQKQELAVLTAIGTAFGVTLPDAIGDTGDAFDGLGRRAKDALGQIPRDINIGVHYRSDEFPHDGNAIPFSSGGLVPFLPKAFANGGMVPSEAMLKRIQPVYAAGGFFAPRGTDTVPAMLSPGEFVVSRRGVQSAGMPALRSINNGVAPVGGGNVTTINVYVNNKLDHAESQKIAAAIAPHIPGVVANGGSTHGKWARMTKVLAK